MSFSNTPPDRVILHALRAEAWSALTDARVRGSARRHFGRYRFQATVQPGPEPGTSNVRLVVSLRGRVLESHAQIVHKH